MVKTITVNQAGKITKDFLEENDPVDFVSFLFDMQNELISNGYCEMLTEKGRLEFSSHFSDLKNLFMDLQSATKDK